MSKRKQHSPDFKAKVALEALKCKKTVSELASQSGIHPAMIQRIRPVWLALTYSGCQFQGMSSSGRFIS